MPETSLLTSHENRIDRLETALDEVSKTTSKTEVLLGGIQDKLDQLLEVSKKSNFLNEVTKTRLSEIEAYVNQQKAKNKWINRALMSLVVTSAVGVIEFFINHFFKHI